MNQINSNGYQSNSQLTVYNQCRKGFEKSYFNRQCIQLRQNKSKEFKQREIIELVEILIKYFGLIKYKQDMNALFQSDMIKNLKFIFNQIISLGMIDEFKQVFESINEISNRVSTINGPQPIFLAGNFIAKDDLVTAVDVALKNDDFHLAKESLFYYFGSFSPDETMPEDHRDRIKRALEMISKVYESVSYVKKDSQEKSKADVDIFKEIFTDIIFLCCANTFSSKIIIDIRPYDFFKNQFKHIQSFNVSYDKHVVTEEEEHKDYTYIELPVQHGSTQEFQKYTTSTSLNDSIKHSFENKKQNIISASSQQSFAETLQQQSRSEQHFSNQLLRGAERNINETLGSNRSQLTSDVDHNVDSRTSMTQQTNSESNQNSLQSSTNTQRAQSFNHMLSNNRTNVDHETYGVRSETSNRVLTQDQHSTHQKAPELFIGLPQISGVSAALKVPMGPDKSKSHVESTETATSSGESSTHGSSSTHQDVSSTGSHDNFSSVKSQQNDQLVNDSSMIANGDNKASMKSCNHQVGINESSANSFGKNVSLNLSDQQNKQYVLSTDGSAQDTRSQQSSDNLSNTTDRISADHQDNTVSQTETFEVSRILEPGFWHVNIHTLQYLLKTSKWFNVKEYQFKFDETLNSDETIDRFRTRLTNLALRREFQEIHQDEKVVKPNGSTTSESIHIKNCDHGELLLLFRYFKLIEQNLNLSSDELASIFNSFSTCFRCCGDQDIDGLIKTVEIKKLCENLASYKFKLNVDNTENQKKLLDFQTRFDELTQGLNQSYASKLPPNKDSGSIFYHNALRLGFNLSASRLISLEDSCKHVAIMGGSGSGKSERFFKHGIMSLTDQNALVTDIDGTLYNSTAHLKEREGYTIKVLDLMDSDESDQFNPLLNLSFDDDGVKYLEGFFKTVDGGNNKIFVEGGQSIAEFALKLLIYESKQDSNAQPPSLPALYEKVMSLDYKKLTELRDDFKSKSEGDKSNAHLKKLYDLSQLAFKEMTKEYGDHWMFAQLALKRLADRVFQKVTGGEDAIFDSISDSSKKTIVYLKVAGSKVNDYSNVMGLFFQHYFATVKGIVAEVKKEFPSNEESDLNIRPTLCFLDEFGNFKINNFHTEITTIRKFKIGCMVALQAGEQLDEQYGKNQADVIAKSFETKIYLNFDLDDQAPERIYHYQDKVKRFKMINGNQVEVEEPLLSLDNIRKLDINHAILVRKGMNPIRYETLRPLELEPRPESVAVPINSTPEFYMHDPNLMAIKSAIFPDGNCSANHLRIIEAAFLTGVPEILTKLPMINRSNLSDLLKHLKERVDIDMFCHFKDLKDAVKNSEECARLNRLTGKALIKEHFDCPAKMVHLDAFQWFYSYSSQEFAFIFDWYLNLNSELSEIDILQYIMKNFSDKLKHSYGNFDESMLGSLILNLIYSQKYNSYLGESLLVFRSFDDVQFELYKEYRGHFNHNDLPEVSCLDKLKKTEVYCTRELKSYFLNKDRYCFIGVHLWLSLNTNGQHESNYVLHLLLFSKNLLEYLIKDKEYGDYNALINDAPWKTQEGRLKYIVNRGYLTSEDLERYFKSIFLNRLLEMSKCFTAKSNYNKALNLKLSDHYTVKYIKPIGDNRFEIDILDTSDLHSLTCDVFSVQFCPFQNESYTVVHKPHNSFNKSDLKSHSSGFQNSYFWLLIMACPITLLSVLIYSYMVSTGKDILKEL
ncbi:MAG: type IV secretory system conjugative DNA transfer family protein [Candidatus Margulisiibacteriota bacterium]|nr:type IV secretory system conjugative DNA transfer family protein [Candidatus Margulisiibacteriota bacterium]